MLSTLLVVLQLMFSGVIAYCFYAQMKASGAKSAGKPRRYTKEMDSLRSMRQIKLNTPLNEAIRPKKFSDIIGQEEGLKALSAILCSPNPQHIIIYGPPGVGKTCAARVALEEAKACGRSPFRKNAPFVEVDATIVRFDERAIADPLIGSVHDPIYQGAGSLGVAGVPQPKPGAVTKAHGGILFIDEIGELHPIQMNKLLKVMEDRKVMLESAYYNSEDAETPAYIHDVFKNGLPADFRLIGATTRSPDSISPAIRSRAIELYFKPLNSGHIRLIAKNAAASAGLELTKDALNLVAQYAGGGRDAANLVQVAAGFALGEDRGCICAKDLQCVIKSGNYAPRLDRRIKDCEERGYINGLAVAGPGLGSLLWIQAVAAKGSGRFEVTGIIDEEEMGGQGRSSRRRSQASCSVKNVQTALKKIGIDLSSYDVHIDFPGGVPIDGPSAGIAMALCCYSAITGVKFDRTVAVTGEISLSGEAMPVGGIAEKVEAARLAGAKRVIMPASNAVHAEAENIEICPCKDLWEAIELAQMRESESAAILPAPAQEGAILTASER